MSTVSNRIETLENLLAQAPTDSRLRYMLASEYKNGGQLELAVREFRSILTHDTSYGPAYYHGGQTLEQLNRIEEARAMYAAGIEATTRSGDSHTRGELEVALSILG
ncbi:tetratricopeptide repeat protein [Bryobacter aggregatus]|uniref:tetratricopeptide repeat protein n=1 Tax=Bryobacter aggregatus TaxID=360054 RepID=UPI0004E2778D|nr:tetratricopeptide repeat protein [Bryobacter aggregatus]